MVYELGVVAYQLLQLWPPSMQPFELLQCIQCYQVYIYNMEQHFKLLPCSTAYHCICLSCYNGIVAKGESLICPLDGQIFQFTANLVNFP